VIAESGWTSDYSSDTHYEQSLASSDDVTSAVPVSGVIFNSEFLLPSNQTPQSNFSRLSDG